MQFLASSSILRIYDLPSGDMKEADLWLVLYINFTLLLNKIIAMFLQADTNF